MAIELAQLQVHPWNILFTAMFIGYKKCSFLVFWTTASSKNDLLSLDMEVVNIQKQKKILKFKVDFNAVCAKVRNPDKY